LLIAFINTFIGSRIRDMGSGAFFPRIRDPDLGSKSGSGIRIREGAMVGSGSGIKHPGSATLVRIL
jgi:hypothetical protein